MVYPMKDWFYICSMGKYDVTFLDHPFIGFEGEFFPFSIFVRFYKVEFSIWIHFQGIYITIIVEIIEEELDVLWFCHKASFFLKFS